MKKIVLLVNLFLTLLFSFSVPVQEIENNRIVASPINNAICSLEDTLVNITTTNNLINVSGFIIDKDQNSIYIATSYKHYKQSYHYEVVFNDYSRAKAQVVGYAKEDKVLILKVHKKDNVYCQVTLSKSEYLDNVEEVNIFGKANYKTVMADAIVSSIGVCKNCTEETFKNYYYSVLQGDVPSYLIGAGVYDKKGALLGIVIETDKNTKMGVRMLDVNKLYSISYNLINFGKYEKNYIKYNLLDVNSLTNKEKYLYSLDEGMTSGVLVSSIHYLNYIKGGLNLGMVILKVNDVFVDSKYELDNELSKYLDNSEVKILVKKTNGSYKTYRVKL